MDVECCRMLSRHFVHEPGNSTLHFAFFSIFALFAFYLGFLFLKQLHESRRQPLIYRPGYILVVLLVYLSIHEYHNCIVEFWSWHWFGCTIGLACIYLFYEREFETFNLSFSFAWASWSHRNARKWKAHCRIYLQCMPAAFWIQICIWTTSTQQMVDRDALLLSGTATQRTCCDPASEDAYSNAADVKLIPRCR